MCTRAPAHTAAVFVEGHIADPMEPVFNRPMVSAQGEQALGIGLLGFQAGEAINGFGAELLGDLIGGVPADREDLTHMGKGDVIVQIGAGPDMTDFQSAVILIGRGVLRGEKTPTSGQRYLDGAWADCL